MSCHLVLKFGSAVLKISLFKITFRGPSENLLSSLLHIKQFNQLACSYESFPAFSSEFYVLGI
jgi:hypothetical protein